MSTPLAPRDANARGDDAGTREKRFDADVDDARARRASRPRRVSFKTMDDRGEVAPTVDLKTARGETRAKDGAENDATDATRRDEREERGLTKTLARGDGAVGTTTRERAKSVSTPTSTTRARDARRGRDGCRSRRWMTGARWRRPLI